MSSAGGGDQTAFFQFASRVVSQDDVEDGDVLVPITGLSKTFAKLAAECIQHIIDASPDFAAKVEAEGGWKIRIKAAEMFAKKIVQKPDRNPHKLLLCFIVAIHLYTQEWVLYKELNACLRSRDRKRLLPFFPYLRLLLTAFSCIPPSAVTVFRGVKKDLTGKFLKGEQAVWWSVTSTTSSMGTLQEEMFLGKSGKRTMFCIASKTFRDIRHYSAIGVEAECCGLPGTCFHIDDLLDQGDLQIVQMSENMEDCMLDFTPDVPAYAALEASTCASAALLPAVFTASSVSPLPPSSSLPAGGSAIVPPAAGSAIVPPAAGSAPASQTSSPIAAELQALADVFVSLKVGPKETCVAFAVELSKQGVMAVEDFSEVTEADARDMMARAGMSKLQQNRVVQAEAERKSAAAAAAAAKKAQDEAAAAKKAQDEAAAAEKKVRGLLPCVGFKHASCATRHPPLQAAAAARIAGKPDIIAAAKSGDLALVQDHVTADASCVSHRDKW
jgi:hypothetical protein